MTSNRTFLKLRDLSLTQALHEVACWLDDCDTHVATKRDGGLPMPWFNLAEGFSIVEAASRDSDSGALIAIARIREVTGLGRRPMLSELPDAVAALVDALKEAREEVARMAEPALDDPANAAEVRALGERIGYGALMSCASRVWFNKGLGGALAVGPHIGVAQRLLKKIDDALAAKAEG